MAETWCARRLTLNLIIIITITRKEMSNLLIPIQRLPYSVFWIMFILPGMITQMQASKTNCQMVLMELWCPQLLFPPSIQWCFMPERSCFDGYGYGLQAQELIQQCCAIYWAVYQALLFASLPCFAGWYASMKAHPAGELMAIHSLQWVPVWPTTEKIKVDFDFCKRLPSHWSRAGLH